jgi:hypothetical protein
VRTGRVKEKVIRDHVRKGQVYGWYFLPADLTRPGFPESLVDLRDLHTVPLALMEGLQARGKHVGRLMTPLPGASGATFLSDLLAHRPARTLWHAGIAPWIPSLARTRTRFPTRATASPASTPPGRPVLPRDRLRGPAR